MSAGAKLLIKSPAECQYFPGSFISETADDTSEENDEEGYPRNTSKKRKV